MFALRPISPGIFVYQDRGFYEHVVAKDAECTVELQERDSSGRRVFVSAEKCVLKDRFVTHPCRPNTVFQEVRGKRRVVVMLM